MPTVFLDTNVIVYAATAMGSDPARHAVAHDLVSGPPYAISAQVVAEFVSVMRRRFAETVPEPVLSEWIDLLGEQGPLPIDHALVRRGAAISARHRINYYDGAILAAAERLGCGTVLSEDMRDGQAYGAVTVRNPFGAPA